MWKCLFFVLQSEMIVLYSITQISLKFFINKKIMIDLAQKPSCKILHVLTRSPARSCLNIQLAISFKIRFMGASYSFSDSLLIEASFKIYGYGHAFHKLIFILCFHSPKNRLTFNYHEKHADFWRIQGFSLTFFLDFICLQLNV